MTDIVSRARRSEMMRGIRGSETTPELIVRRTLHGLGYRYRLHDRELPGRPDVVMKSRRIALFVHGCFWHRHAGCRFAYTPKSNLAFWSRKFAENKQRDRRAARQLRRLGWKVVTVWECETRSPENLVGRLLALIEG